MRVSSFQRSSAESESWCTFHLVQLVCYYKLVQLYKVAVLGVVIIQELENKWIKRHLHSGCSNIISHVLLYEPWESQSNLLLPLWKSPWRSEARGSQWQIISCIWSLSPSPKDTEGFVSIFSFYVGMTRCHFGLAGGPLSMMIYWFFFLLLWLDF